MALEPDPGIGDCYQNSIGDTFEVVAFEVVAEDDEGDTAESQYYHGTQEEPDPEAWGPMQPEAIEPPENCSGSTDVAHEYSAISESWEETGEMSEYLI